MISAVVISLYICMRPELPVVKIVQVVFAVLIIVRHHANIKRIINHNENTISWLPKLRKIMPMHDMSCPFVGQPMIFLISEVWAARRP